MEPRLSLRCLGEPVLTGLDGEPVRFKVRKHLALLVFLAVESRSRHHRDHLAELLWANLPEGDNRHSLATALSTIRAVAGADALETDRDHVRINRGRFALDLDRLESGDVLASEFQPALDIAGFLDGFEVPGSSEFMLWRERQRSRWLPLVREALLKRIDKCRRTGDFRQIEHLGDRMLHLDELSEEAVRAKMEARAFAGDRLGALKVFEAWKERLFEDLGASPSPLVEGMAIRLRRRGLERPATSLIPAVPTDQWKGRPFVGRANEYQGLYEGWERTQRGVAGHAILLGDSGIGKSTLADRLATAAGLEGAVTSRVQCYDVEREIPYAAIAGLVQGLLHQPGVSGTPPEALAELARAVPEVKQKYPNVPPPVDSQGETARILLTEAFHQLLQSLAEEQPVILVVDDLHLADDASLAVLHLMMRRAQGEPIMVVFATRPESLGQSPQASRIRENAERLGIRMIELGPMNDDESAELLASFIPEDEPQPGAAARRALLRAAAGYPMVLELLVQDWRTNGEQSVALSVEAMTSDPAMRQDGPSGAYRQLLERLTNTLDPATRNVLNMAAILGGRLNDLSAYALADLTRGQTMSGMAQLVRLRILRERGDRLEFANELIRAHAYVGVPSPLRRELHGEIAGRLLAEAADGASRSGLEIAWHCFRGGRTAEGIPHLLSGAREALAQGAPHEVERALTSALPLLDQAQSQHARLLIAEALQEEGDALGSLTLLDDLRKGCAAEHLGLVDILSIWAHLRLFDLGHDNAGAALHRLEELVDLRAPELAARAVFVAAGVLYDNRDYGRARTFIRLSESLQGLAGESELRVATARAMLMSLIGETGETFDRLIATAKTLPASKLGSSTAVQMLHASAAIRCARGEYDLAITDSMMARAMALRLGNDVALATAAGNLSLCYGRLGDYRAQIDWSERGLQHLPNRFTGYRDVQLAWCRAFGYAMLRQVDAAQAALADGRSRIPSVIPAWMLQTWQLRQADVLHIIGRKHDALSFAKSALGHGGLLSESLVGPFARWLAMEATKAGTPYRARQQLQQFRSKLSSYDAIDQVEILAAICWLDTRSESNRATPKSRAENAKLIERLANLPSAVAAQLTRLSILERTR